MPRIVVAGSSGFIGRRVVAALRATTEWRVVEFDVDDTLPNDGDVEYVINLAADADARWTIDHPVATVDNTVGVAARLLRYASEHNVERFIQVSTVEVYGTGHCDHTVDCALRPETPYAAAKASQDVLALAWRQTYGLRTIVARTGNVFGATQPAARLLPTLVRRARAGDPLVVVPGLRRFIHVDDVAQGLVSLLAHDESEHVVHVTGNKLIDHGTFARLVRDALGSTSPIELTAATRPGQCGDVSGVPSTVPGWNQRGLAARIRECVAQLGE